MNSVNVEAAGKKSKKYGKKVIARAACFMMVIIISALSLYIYLVDVIKTCKQNAIDMNYDNSFERVYSELLILKDQASDNCARITKDIEEDLRSLDMLKLREDFDNGVINADVYEIIEKHIRGVSLNDINNYKNGIIVMTQNGVLEDYNYERATSQKVRNWESEIDKSWNKKLEQDAINKILNHASDKLIATEKNDLGKDHIKIDEMTKNNLKKVFMEEGMDGLRNYQFKVASYITETGDIFGQEDIVHGIRHDTHKIIVVQEFNLYDQLSGISPEVFNDNDQLLEIERRYSHILSITYIMGLFFLASVIILLFYFSHMYNYYIWAYDNALEKDENREKIINGKY